MCINSPNAIWTRQLKHLSYLDKSGSKDRAETIGRKVTDSNVNKRLCTQIEMSNTAKLCSQGHRFQESESRHLCVFSRAWWGTYRKGVARVPQTRGQAAWQKHEAGRQTDAKWWQITSHLTEVTARTGWAPGCNSTTVNTADTFLSVGR